MYGFVKCNGKQTQPGHLPLLSIGHGAALSPRMYLAAEFRSGLYRHEHISAHEILLSL